MTKHNQTSKNPKKLFIQLLLFVYENVSCYNKD